MQDLKPKVLYVGIGAFGYSVFYDEDGKAIRASQWVYNTFYEARRELLRLEKINLPIT